MIYALVGFIGVCIGAACVYVFSPTVQVCVPEKEYTVSQEAAEDARLAKQWQSLLNFTADAGGDDDE